MQRPAENKTEDISVMIILDLGFLTLTYFMILESVIWHKVGEKQN